MEKGIKTTKKWEDKQPKQKVNIETQPPSWFLTVSKGTTDSGNSTPRNIGSEGKCNTTYQRALFKNHEAGEVELFNNVEFEEIPPHQLEGTYYEHIDTYVPPSIIFNAWYHWWSLG